MSAKANTTLIDRYGPWEAARQQFLQDLSPEDKAVFKQWLRDGKSPTTLKQEIDALEKRNQAVGKMKPLIQGLRGLDSIISPLAGLDAHGVVTILWGGTKVLMTLAETAMKFFETITDFLEDIGHQLGIFREYEALFSKHGSERFNLQLHRVYSSYLYFCSSARTFYLSSKWRKFLESTGFSRRKYSSNVDLAVAEVKTACSRAKEEVDLVQAQTSQKADNAAHNALLNISSDVQRLEIGVSAVQQDVEDVSNKLANINFSEFRGWLRVPQLDMEEELKSHLRKRASLPNTCSWVFADKKVRDWASSADDSAKALWIKADAGFGKSVLASYIIAETQKLHPTGVAYFFCKHDNERQKSITNVLRTWIWQLMSKKTINGQDVDSHLAILPDTVLDFENRGVGYCQHHFSGSLANSDSCRILLSRRWNV